MLESGAGYLANLVPLGKMTRREGVSCALRYSTSVS